MVSYLKAENLKLKGTFTRKLILSAPIGTMLLGLVMGIYYQQNAFNWWYIMMFPGSIALFCALVNQKEEKKMKYRAVFPLPIDLKKVWFSKIVIIAIYALLASVVLSLSVMAGRFIYTAVTPMSITKLMAAGISITITSLWQIPLCLFLAKKFGFFPPVILNVGIGLVLDTWMATKALWWLCPYSWTSRLICPILGILPNGLLAEAKDPLLNSNVIPVGIGLSIVLFIILLLATAHWFKKQEVL